MINYDIFSKRKSAAYRVFCGFLAFTFFFSWILPPGYAQLIPQNVLNLPAPGTMVTPSAAFTPAIINGITIHPENPLEFDFIIGTGDEKLEGRAFAEESTRLIKYFLAALTVPEDEMWVNLSPHEKDRIIPDGFGTTAMGRDLLAQDYILKQLTASLMYPEKELGKKFWNKIYRQAREKYGTAEIPVNTFNKVWIVPEEAVVYENGSSAFVVKSRLRVMLEEDYQAMNKGVGTGLKPVPTDHDLSVSTEIIREVILPAIEKEVNEGKSFANLRQIYNSAILAAWFKQNLRQTLLGQVYVDKAKTKGIDVEDKTVNQKIYEQYLEAFKKGVYNYIKEDYDPATQEVIPRKYFSGGASLTKLSTKDVLKTYKNGQTSSPLQQKIIDAFLGGQSVGQQKLNIKLLEWSKKASKMSDADVKEIVSPKKLARKSSSPVVEGERVATTITGEDFKALVRLRGEGKIGFHRNVDPAPVIPASGNVVLNWSEISSTEKERLIKKEQEMYREGRIAPIIMAGGEATRFGGPKTFVKVSDDLGEFLGIKADNLRWLQETFGTNVPLYLLSSEKRLLEFKQALEKRDYYGLNPEMFQWYVQGVVDTFIPTDEEIKSNFKGDNVARYKAYAEASRKANPDGIYRFQGKRRKVPGGHFDAIASFIISGRFSDALKRGIAYGMVFNIDNLQAVLKNDGSIAHFAEQNKDFGFLLAEKNLKYEIRLKNKGVVVKLTVRFMDNVISFDGIHELTGKAEKDGVIYEINREKKSIDVRDASSGQAIETEQIVIPEAGGTLVQPVDESGNPVGQPTMKEGFELKSDFDHANAPFFNTNTIMVSFKSLLHFLDVSAEDLGKMDFDQRSNLVRAKLVKQIKPNFEFKNHEVEGEYPDLGVVKNGKTKIPVSQVTRIMLQVAHLKEAEVIYYNFPRKDIFAPVKEPEDIGIAAANNREPLRAVTRQASSPFAVTGMEERQRTSSLRQGRSSSPAQAISEIARREVPGILRQMDDVYGLTNAQAAGLTGNRFAHIGFDGDANRMGWTVNYLKEILQNPAMLQQTLKDAEDIRNNYENVVFIGMGGSGLGVEVIKSTFGKETGPRIFSLRTTDPATIDEMIKQLADSAGGDLKIALERTKFVVISKTFTTQEVLFNRDYFEKSYQDLGIENVSRHFVLVTDPGSKLDAAAAQQAGYEVRYIQLNKKTDIGGRNTTFTNINLLPLAILAPEKVMPFLQEALRMNQKGSVEEDVFAVLGVYLHYMATGYSARKDKVTFIVPEELRALPMWSEQLIEESLGKDGKGISVVYGEDLTAQKLRDPAFARDRVFLRFNLGGQLTRPDLAEALSGREDVIDIDFGSVDQIGALMLGLQRAVAVIAYRWNTNFVNQPGVEGYKRETSEVLASIKKGQLVEVPHSWGYGTFDQLKIYYTPFIEAGIITKEDLEREVAEFGSDLSDGAAVYAALVNIARKTGKFELAEIASYGHMNPAVWSVMQKARTDIFTDLLKAASKLGEGPDRNHSFHQSVEQGPDYHLSTYLMPLETPQPPHREYDVNPLRAQTLGTVQSLVNARRKVVLITIEGRIADSQPVLKEFFDRVHSLLRRDEALEQSSSRLTDLLSKKTLHMGWNHAVPSLYFELPNELPLNKDNYWDGGLFYDGVHRLIDISGASAVDRQTVLNHIYKEIRPQSTYDAWLQSFETATKGYGFINGIYVQIKENGPWFLIGKYGQAGATRLAVLNLNTMEIIRDGIRGTPDWAAVVVNGIQGRVEVFHRRRGRELGQVEYVQLKSSSPALLPQGDWERWAQTEASLSDLNEDMFRDYDYRNIGPFLKPEVVFRLGLVWADMALKKAETAGITNRTVLVAKDPRKVEPEMIDALVAALRYRGLDVIYIAKDTSNAVISYSWAVQQFKPLMSIFITASHVSKPEDQIVRGFKVTMLDELGGDIQSLSKREIKGESLKAVREIFQDPDKVRAMEAVRKGTFTAKNIDENVIRFNTLIGKIVAANASLYELGEAIKKSEDALNVLAQYEERYRDVLPLKGMRIVVDGSHTPSGMLTIRTFRNLGAEVIGLNEDIREVSGPHKADPSIRENLKGLEDKIIETVADFGMAFDLDGDRGVIHVPIRSFTMHETQFQSLAPDNLIAILLPYLKKNWGYNLSGKRYGVIRDVLGSHGVNDRARDLEMEFSQTDAGYVFLKEKKKEKGKEGVIFPMYGERSGHAWLHVAGEIENPLAVGVLFAMVARREKKAFFDKRVQGAGLDEETINPILDVIREKEVPYAQSPRFQPLFHPDLLARLSEDGRNTTGWHYDRNTDVWYDGGGKSKKNPPQAIITLGRDMGIKMLKEEFVPGQTYATPDGTLVVKEFNDYLDPEEGMYRFADIVFQKDGRFAGRFVFRASSNDPSFVNSYEAPLIKITAVKKKSIAGPVIDFLVSRNLAIVTKGEMKKLLPHLSDHDLQKQYDSANLFFVEKDYFDYKEGTISSVEIGETDIPPVNILPDETQDLGKGDVPPESSSPAQAHEIDVVNLSSPKAREEFEQVSRNELYFWAEARKGDKRAMDALHFLGKARVFVEENSAGRLYLLKLREGEDLVPVGIAVVDAKEDPRGGVRVEVDISASVTDRSVRRDFVLKIVKDHPSDNAVYFRPADKISRDLLHEARLEIMAVRDGTDDLLFDIDSFPFKPLPEAPFFKEEIMDYFLDLEGVILDTIKLYRKHASFIYAMILRGVKNPEGFEPTAAELKAGQDFNDARLGSATKDSLKVFLENLRAEGNLKFSGDMDQLIAYFNNLYEEMRRPELEGLLFAPADKIREILMPQVMDFLEAAKKQGVKLRIVSVVPDKSKQEVLMNLLSRLGINKEFQEIIFVRDIKEKIMVIRDAIKGGLAGKEVLFVDDAPDAIKAAQEMNKGAAEKDRFWVAGMPRRLSHAWKMDPLAHHLVRDLGGLVQASSPVDVAQLIMDLKDSPDEDTRIKAAGELGSVSPTTDQIVKALKLAVTRKGETMPVRLAARQAMDFLAEAKADVRTAVSEVEETASSPTTEDDGDSGSVKKMNLYDNIISGTYPVLPKQETKKEVGGINLDPKLFDLQIRRDANGVPLPLPMQPIEQMNIEGFIPVIINITPVTNLPLLLGLAETGEGTEEMRPTMKAREPEEISALN